MASNQHLIVGLGASAGGLEAFKGFFVNMPPDSGMAFVLIQHLAPEKTPLLQPVRRTEPAAFLCPHCALALRLKDDADGTLVYDIPSWHRRCRHRGLESPALCQLISRDAVAIH